MRVTCSFESLGVLDSFSLAFLLLMEVNQHFYEMSTAVIHGQAYWAPSYELLKWRSDFSSLASAIY